jgi:hypothetical protein
LLRSLRAYHLNNRPAVWAAVPSAVAWERHCRTAIKAESIMLGESWRTSLFGILAGLSILISQVKTLLDKDPSTNIDISLIIASITGIIAAISARDNKVTSEEAGAGK